MNLPVGQVVNDQYGNRGPCIFMHEDMIGSVFKYGNDLVINDLIYADMGINIASKVN